jgi:hypothetical protein
MTYNDTGANQTEGGGLNPADNGGGEGTVVTWSSIRVTTFFSLVQGLVLFGFFLLQRYRERKHDRYTLYETRQFTRRNRSPAPYGKQPNIDDEEEYQDVGNDDNKAYGMGPFGWAVAAYNVPNDELLQCVGADTFMYLRFLRLGFRITCFGSLLALLVLIPVYATADGSGANTEDFNRLTLAKVLPNSPRLYASVVCWFVFVAFVLRDFWMEWVNYRDVRREFYLNGDVDTPNDFRYTIMVENVPRELRSAQELISYFDSIFPGKVRQASLCLRTGHLNDLVKQRQAFLEMHEQADAYRHANPDKPTPTKRIDATCICLGGKVVDTLAYSKDEVKLLNDVIDQERSALHRFADQCNSTDMSEFRRSESGGLVTSTLGILVKAVPIPTSNAPNASATVDKNRRRNHAQEIEGDVQAKASSLHDSDRECSPKDVRSSLDDYAKALGAGAEADKSQSIEQAIVSHSTIDNIATSTAFVTFTSLVATNSSIQCNITGKADNLVSFRSPEPNGIIWSNITVSLGLEQVRQMWAAGLWTLGVLFWTIPVAFVTSLANLSTILDSIGVNNVDTGSNWYGLVSGLLPVLALNLLTALVPIVIKMCAMTYIRMKRVPQVDTYVYFWHQLYQFANLWLIIIGGSIYSQLNKILNGASGVKELVDDVAKAMAGQSVFFVDMIVWGSFAAFGMELSMLSTYGLQLLKTLIQPEAMRTQRMLDEAKKPKAVRWGDQLPPIIFVFLVALVYMPIVPMIEVFAAVYFGGMYIVWKHQCLHVYAQTAEGGGLIWERLFDFLVGCLYTSEACFIAYMGIKVSLYGVVHACHILDVILISAGLSNLSCSKPQSHPFSASFPWELR